MIKNQLNTNKLNNNQLQAVTAPLGPTLVIAGPGSGKTFVITQRINYMLTQLGCQSNHILVITFTKAAAEEMKSRYVNMYGNTAVQFGTFHSIFFKILRMTDKNRYDLQNLLPEDKKKKIIESLYKETDGDAYEDFVETFLAHLTLMKNQLIQPKYYNPDGLSKEIFMKVYKGYEDYKERQQLFDFDDMLVDCYYTLENNPQLLQYIRKCYQHILIDEFQDINCVQFEIIKHIATDHKDLFVVGDDDQSIYQFRGAKPEFLLSFESYFDPVNKIILDQNYRSTEPILDYSNALICHNKNRYVKEMKTTNREGEKPYILTCDDSKEQGKTIASHVTKLLQEGHALSDCAVIYRTNVQARPLVEAFMAAHIPFVLKDNILTLYDQWITKDILAYLHAAEDLTQTEKILQIINRPSRYISKAILNEVASMGNNLLTQLTKSDKLSTWQKDYVQELIYHLQCLKRKPLVEGIAYIRQVIGYNKYLNEYAQYRKIPVSNLTDVLAEIVDSASAFQDVGSFESHLELLSLGLKQNAKSKHDGVIFTTMHSAKGLEFKNVFVIDVLDGVIPHNKSTDDKQLEEERRLLYVALTRAKEKLYLYVPKTRYQEKAYISPFVDEMLYKPIHISEGTTIVHKHYGKGEVLQLEDTKARIQFSNATRVIDYEYCLKQKLIYREEH